MLFKFYKDKKKSIKYFLKKENIFYINIFNIFFIPQKKLFLFLIDKKILNLSDDSLFFKENLFYISELYINYPIKNINLLKIKYLFEKENKMFKLNFEKKYEYYLFKIEHINKDIVYFFYSYDNIKIIQENINIFLNKKLKMSEKRIEHIKEQLINKYLNGYDISFKNYIFDLETNDDYLYTGIFENIKSGNLIIVKNIKTNQYGEIVNAGEKNNELTL